MLFGKGPHEDENVVIIELKQWWLRLCRRFAVDFLGRWSRAVPHL
jgi:hypothetical protein